jgi:DNA invertase Pin-like site-specific DNA recombinase
MTDDGRPKQNTSKRSIARQRNGDADREAREFVVYIRVSTDRQGQSGLGVEAQREAVETFMNRANGVALAEFVEVESGKRADRPKLREALAVCRREHATLLIAKLDRLARSVHFISGLLEGGVEFVAVDNPHANRLMLHLLAAFAEHEREMISQRTRAALAAAKARGAQLGQNGKLLAERHRRAADAFATLRLGAIVDAQMKGARTLQQIADALNAEGVASAKGGRWHPTSVRRVLGRTDGGLSLIVA